MRGGTFLRGNRLRQQRPDDVRSAEERTPDQANIGDDNGDGDQPGNPSVP
jgi:hypothetical protein